MGTRQEASATQIPPIHPAGDLECEDFLELVYGERKGWVDLPAKVGQYWVPFYMGWPKDRLLSQRIDGCVRDREDLYYSVNMFSRKGRREEETIAGNWLWADLDEIHPTAASRLGLLPTVAIESSVGRFQALWKLTRELPPATLLKLNRGLTYALDADKGGWDLTQVLRLPGTRNFKYSPAPFVRMLWMNEGTVYDPKTVWAAIRDLVPKTELAGAIVRERDRKPIPRRAKALLRVGADEVVEGERSARLWELECLLAESGLTQEEIFDLVWPTPWNKWKTLGTGRDRLTSDIRKAVRHVSAKDLKVEKKPAKEGEGEGEPEVKIEALPFKSFNSFVSMALPRQRWLVKNLWMLGSHGLIAGEPKTNKTTLAMALALSVATGKPFLMSNEYPVGDPGPVLFVQEENSPKTMQERLIKLSHFYEILGSGVKTHNVGGRQTYEIDFPKEYDLKFLNNFGFNLDLDEHCNLLIAEIEETKPKLIVLDPMYLILNADENSSMSLRPFLRWLLDIRYKYNTAIAVVHHNRKAPTAKGSVQPRPGQRVMGSAMLHGWVDSAIYLSHVADSREGWVTVGLEREFRSAAPRPGITLGLKLGEHDALDTEVEWGSIGSEDKVLDGVAENSGIRVRDLAVGLKMDYRTVLKRCEGLGDYVFVVQRAGVASRVYLNTDPKARRLKAEMNGA